MSKFHCKFQWQDGGFFVTKADALSELKDGFWVNGYMEFTKASDCRFWIPPSRIVFIEVKRDA